MVVCTLSSVSIGVSVDADMSMLLDCCNNTRIADKSVVCCATKKRIELRILSSAFPVLSVMVCIPC